MQANNEFKEFWIKLTSFDKVGMGGFRYSDCEISVDPDCGKNYKDFKNSIHVITYDKYQSALAELEKLKAELMKQSELNQANKLAYGLLKKEHDTVLKYGVEGQREINRKQYAEYKKELTQIKIDMSGVCGATVGTITRDLQSQLATLKEASEGLVAILRMIRKFKNDSPFFVTPIARPSVEYIYNKLNEALEQYKQKVGED